MKQSEFNYIKRHGNFTTGFKGALAQIIAEIIDTNTADDVSIETIDYKEYKRREWAYSMAGTEGNVKKYIDDLRPLFPTMETGAYHPFKLDETDSQWADGVPNIDDAELILYQRIKDGGYDNYWAKVKSEDIGKMYINGKWQIPE